MKKDDNINAASPGVGTVPSGRPAKGRPREFDVEKALDAAVMVFWRKGYEGTSMPDLTEAMGINRPSLYAAFGNKESLFRKVVERYLQSVGGFVTQALAEPKVRDAIWKLLASPLKSPQAACPRGCLLVNAALACGDEAELIRQELTQRRSQNELAVRDRLARALVEGELRPSTDVKALAKFIASFNNGLAVQGSGGARADDLLQAAELAMQVIDAALLKGARKQRK